MTLDPKTTIAIIGITYGAASEIIGLLPIRQNSVVQVVLRVLGMVIPKR
jgi:hypothetical protein